MMHLRQLILTAAFAVGLGTAASATPLAAGAPQIVPPDTVVAFAKWKAKHAFKGNRGHHLGWYRGRHCGWYKKGRHRGVYFR